MNAHSLAALAHSAHDGPTFWPIMISAFFGAFFAFLAARVGDVLAAIYSRGRQHRTALSRFERWANEYLNQLISNKRLARDSARAAEAGHLYWRFPHTFETDRSFALEIFDLDLAQRVARVNLHLLRFNRDVEDLRRAHIELQAALIGGHIPFEAWKGIMQREAPQWTDLAVYLEQVLEDEVRDACVRAYLLAKQYDSRRAHLWRAIGRLRVWPLSDASVAEERGDFDRRREIELKKTREEMARIDPRATQAAKGHARTS